jgi:hypothetical protein
MTEAEWLASRDPAELLDYLSSPDSWADGLDEPSDVTDRRIRLFAVACCRLIWHLIAEQSRDALEVCERHADCAATDEQLEDASDYLTKVMFEAVGRDGSDSLAANVTCAASTAAFTEPDYPLNVYLSTAVARAREAGHPLGPLGGQGVEVARLDGYGAEADLVREVFGNPFRRVALERAWRTPAVVSLARAAYEERIPPTGDLDLSRLAVLSDALEEAGCDDAAILDHLRSPGPHVRGCWALDVVLGLT